MDITWLELIVFILASYRLTNLFIYDSIMEWMRRPFHQEIEEEHEVVLVPKGKGIQAFIGELLLCHWCTGFWVSAGVLLSYLIFPSIYLLWILFAISGATSLFMHVFPRE
ncbi:DUF1360 domain-containing protein [Pontibacillus litoralis]|uniref:Sporulation protein yjcA n=1 Tax=Pontibacillus litoralis JSM 072002 TaxID=1385512 RepID=A0A0A5G9B7_9BACI|nr:DUF1360 domain-containing protein [Pontibacillus litoralis]KGX87705.1 Sporulation protein yjcA [Pontibacillus litoralis JSM 072002]